MLSVGLRVCQSDQMAERPGHDILAAQEAAVALLFAAKHTGKLPRDAGLFSEHQCFSHMNPFRHPSQGSSRSVKRMTSNIKFTPAYP